MTVLGLLILLALFLLACLVSYHAGFANGQHSIRPGETRLHARARAYNAANPNPTCHLDFCGYEYATIKPHEPFVCGGCNVQSIAVEGVTCKVEVAYNNAEAPLGRSHARLGIACSESCADKMFDGWLLARMA